MSERAGSGASASPDRRPSAPVSIPLGPRAPYTAYPFLSDVDLSLDGETGERGRITCVERWEDNVYVGTSTGSLLQFVRIPVPPEEPGDQPGSMFIQATRLQPETAEGRTSDPRVQKILLLPRIKIAVVIAGGSLNFFTLPELSPAFSKLRPFACSWVEEIKGLPDPNLTGGKAGSSQAPSSTIALSLKQKIRRVVLDQSQPRRLGDVEFAGSVEVVCRGRVACVADKEEYALVDLVGSQKIGLFPILQSEKRKKREQEKSRQPVRDEIGSSGDDDAAQKQDRLEIERRQKEARAKRQSLQFAPGHSRTGSAGVSARSSFDVPAGLKFNVGRLSLGGIGPGRARAASASETRDDGSEDKPETQDEEKDAEAEGGKDEEEREEGREEPDGEPDDRLEPHIVSPTPTEFLLTTGTGRFEKAMGMFVNMEGDVTRGTVQFCGYPDWLVVDPLGGNAQRGYVIAGVRWRGVGEEDVPTRDLYLLDIQRWDASETVGALFDLSAVGVEAGVQVGAQRVSGTEQVEVPELADILLLVPIGDGGEEKERAERERETARRMSVVSTDVLCWAGEAVFWLVQNHPTIELVRTLEGISDELLEYGPVSDYERREERIKNVIHAITSQAHFEVDVHGMTVVGQLAGLLLFVNAMRAGEGENKANLDLESALDVLLLYNVDVRAFLTLFPVLDVSAATVWVYAPVRRFLERAVALLMSQESSGTELPGLVAGPVAKLLQAWRRRRSSGAVAAPVIPVVDLSLLRVLLQLYSLGDIKQSRAAAEQLHRLVSDPTFAATDSARGVLEVTGRLDLLVRLFQTQGRTGELLDALQRVVSEAGTDAEVGRGIGQMKDILVSARDGDLSRMYGGWIAARDEVAGVAVLGAGLIEAEEAIAILEQEAPAAVPIMLEQLVERGMSEYVPALAEHCLDRVIAALEGPGGAEVREMIGASYEMYRALSAPKPSYRRFMSENGIASGWGASRVRLLGLIPLVGKERVGGMEGRVRRFGAELLPELVAVAAAAGDHETVLRVLVTGLADREGAVRYCLSGGSGEALRRRRAGTMVIRDGLDLGDSATGVAGPRERQAKLFGVMLEAVFAIEEEGARRAWAAELLDRFGGWFRVEVVVGLLPEEWPLAPFAGYLVGALGRLVRDEAESAIARELWRSERDRCVEEYLELVGGFEIERGSEEEPEEDEDGYGSRDWSYDGESYAESGESYGESGESGESYGDSYAESGEGDSRGGREDDGYESGESRDAGESESVSSGATGRIFGGGRR